MPLQLGNWQLNVNGQAGILNIASVDALGSVTGTVEAWGEAPTTAHGFWNELAQQLTLWVSVQGLSLSPVSSALFLSPPRSPPARQPKLRALAPKPNRCAPPKSSHLNSSPSRSVSPPS